MTGGARNLSSFASGAVALGAAACWPASLLLGALGAWVPAAAAAFAFTALAPGLLVARLLVRDPLDDGSTVAWRALALSPIGWTAVTLVPALLAGLAPADAARWGATVVAFALAGLAGLRRGPSTARPEPAPVRLLPTFGPLVLLLLLLLGAAGWAMAPLGVRFSYHGYLHAGLVAQLANGVLPPENPALAGEPIGFYWIYHWLLATQTALAGSSVLEASPVLNGVALAVYVGSGWRILRSFLAPAAAAAAALAAGFAGDLLFPVVHGLRQAFEANPPGLWFWPFEVLQRGGFGGDPRPLPLFAKFLNMGGVGLGLALWAATLAELAPGVRPRPRLGVVFLLLASLVLFHATTAVAAYAALAAGLFAVALADPALAGDLAARARWLLPHAVVFGAALAVTAPFVASVTLGTHAVGAVPVALDPSFLLYNGRTTLLGGAPLVALAGVGARSLLRNAGRPDPAVLFFTVATGVLLALGVTLRLPDNNQYKLVLVAAMPGGLLLVRLLRTSPLVLRRLILGGAGLLVVAGVVLALRSYRGAIMSARTSPVGDGLYLALPGEPALDGALRWLRRYAPADAVVVSRPVHFGGSPVSAVSGRNAFLLLGGQHTEHHPAAPRRLALARALFETDAPPGRVLAGIRSELDRPLYVLLLRSEQGERFDALRERFAGAPEALQMAYDGDAAIVYAVRGTSGPASLGYARPQAPARPRRRDRPAARAMQIRALSHAVE